MLKLNNQNITLQAGWQFGDYWIPTTEILKWDDAKLSEYGIVKEPEPEPTQEELIAQMESKFNSAVQGVLDKKAIDYGYDNIVSACSYAGAPNPFQEESKRFVTWRGQVWDYCIGELLKVKAGTRPVPEVEAFLLELPAFPETAPSIWKRFFG